MTVAEAERVQEELRREVDLRSSLPGRPATVAGLDVSYEVGSDRVVAAAVLLDVASVQVRQAEFVVGEVTFPYVPGLLAFREVPFLLAALERLTVRPDVLVCDGYGIAHPRRFGLACHLGVLTGLPSFGVAKTPFTARFDPPDPARGSWSPLVDGDETVGRAVRTQAGVKPVFVSVGHRIALPQATDLALALAPRHRIPEATRQADLLSRATLRTLPPPD
ncbi:endonuclease V [Micromonospora sp. SH-82]|uniref:endonuclease V n=1 Tax=Micromonospora sp. SH-82 TaxID=3132938 RepID=UPI003EB8CDE8